jgi:hypothetical protein
MKAIYRKGIPLSVAIVTMTIGVLFTVAFNRLFGPLDNFPRLYKTAGCPDGLHTIALYRRKTLWLCPAECIEVIVEVQGGQGSIVQSERVTSLDVWSDMDLRYPELHCSENAISVGGGRDGHTYEIRRQR